MLKIIFDSECRYGADKIRHKIKGYKDQVRDAKGLSTLRGDLVKSLFNNKVSIEQANQLIQEA